MDRHFVLVIHGTWNPTGVPPKWHQRDDGTPTNFCSALNDLFDRLYGWGRAVWRDDPAVGAGFSWSGANRHEDRLEAAARLAERLVTITTRHPDARIHLIGHSHGCNVILHAIERYLKHLGDEAEDITNRLVLEMRRRTTSEAVREAFEGALGERARAFLDSSGTAVTEVRAAADAAPVIGRVGPPTVAVSELRRKLREVWTTSPESNRLGRIVFLGPVFLSKRWALTRWWAPASILGHVVNFALTVAFTAAFLSFAVELYWFLGWLVTRVTEAMFGWGLPWPRWNPLEWPRVLQWTVGVSVVFAGTTYFAIMNSAWGRRNRNLYFDPAVTTVKRAEAEQPPRPTVFPLECLTVTAGVLDEILLTFSAEPLVFATLVPEVREITRPTIRFRPPRRPVGDANLPFAWMLRWLGAIASWIRALMMFVARPLVVLFERAITSLLLQIVSAPALGVPHDELESAMITASDRLDLPDFFKERRYDAQSLLLKAPLVREDLTARLERYQFLADDVLMNTRKAQSSLLRPLQANLAEIRHRYRRFTGNDVEARLEELERTCVVIEERVKEFAGVVHLTHSAYYNNPDVIQAVACFVATGSPAAMEAVAAGA